MEANVTPLDCLVIKAYNDKEATSKCQHRPISARLYGLKFMTDS
jgi:hypothetical protein